MRDSMRFGDPSRVLDLFSLAGSVAEKIHAAGSLAEICLQISAEFSKFGEYSALTYSRSLQALRLESKSRHPLLDAVEFAQEVPFSELGGAISKTVFGGETQIIPLEKALEELNGAASSGSAQTPSIEGYNVIAVPLRKGSEVLGTMVVGGTGLGHEEKTPVELISRMASMRLELLGSLSMDAPKGAGVQKEWFLRKLMDTVPGAVFYKNRDMRFEDCNTEFETAVGLPRESIIGRTVEDVLPDNADFIKQKDGELLLKGGLQTYELNIKTGAGSKVFLVRKSVALDPEGKLLGMVGVMVDISDLKRTEHFMSVLIDSIPDPVFVVDKERRVIAWNRAIEDLTDLPKDSIIGKGGFEYAIPFYGERRPLLLDLLFERDQRYEGLYARFERGNERIVAEGYVNSKRGRIYVIGHASLIYDSSGNILGGIETFKDITKHKETEEALRQSEERYRAIVDDLTEAIVRYKPDGEITFVNKAFGQMGVAKESLLGKNVLDLMSEEDRKEVVALMSKANENPVARFTSKEVKPDGRVSWVMWVARALHDSSGRILEFQAAGRDITEMKRAEEELQRLVEERTRELHEAERLATIGQIAASVGHDLRAPLQSIINNAYLLGIAASDPRIPAESSSEISDLQRKIARQVAYMDGIISDIRDFSRNLILDTRPVQISSLINEALSLVTIPENVRLSLNVDTRDLLTVDQNMFTRVLVNLVTNAIQAMPSGGDLQINARDCNEWVSLEVRDTGIGIPEENLKKLFTPLFTTKSKGSGLGLAICKRIVEAHGGKIRVESQVGKGTAFIVELPRRAPNPEPVPSVQKE
ncbi:MAG: PAS domain S-box protein [Candidatus Methanosuratincola sp.]|nr:PAS domain S-box protein [Candidatus Methanosuratincola sp.]